MNSSPDGLHPAAAAAARTIGAAQSALPSGPVTHGKAWIEMVHRYLATSVGFLILVITVASWVEYSRPRAQRGGCWLEVVRDEATGRVWALLARPGEARLVPLASPLARRPAVDVTDLAAARRVVRGGVARVTVRAAP